MKKRAGYLKTVLSTMLIALILLVTVVATLPGNKLLARSASFFVPGFMLQIDDRALMHGGRFSLSYYSEEFKFSLENAAMDLQFFSCAVFCIDSIQGQRSEIWFVKNKDDQQVKTKKIEQDSTRRTLSAVFRQLQLEQLTVSYGDFSIQSEAITGQLKWQSNGLDISQLSVGMLDVQLPQSDNSRSNQAPLFSPLKPIKFTSPFAWQIGELSIARAQISQGNMRHVIEKLVLQAKQQGAIVSVSKLVAHYQDIKAQLNGELNFISNNPISLSAVIGNNTDTINVNLSGDLNQLILDMNLTGRYQASANGHVVMTQQNWPFSVAVDLPAVLLPTKPHRTALTQTQLQLDGTLADYHYRLNTNAHVANWQNIEVFAQGRGSLSQATIANLEAKTKHSDMFAKGNVNWRNGLELSLNLNSKQISLNDFSAGLGSDFALDGAINFKQVNQGWQLNVPALTLEGQLNNTLFNADIAFALDDQLQGEITQFNVLNGQNRLSVSGSLKQSWDLVGQFTLHNGQTLHRRLTGQGSGEFFIKGETLAPIVNWSLDLSQFGVGHYAVDQLVSKGSLDISKQYLADIQIRSKGVVAEQYRADKFDFAIAGDLTKHQISLLLATPELELSSALQATLAEKRYVGSIARFDVSANAFAIKNQQPIDFEYGTHSQTVSLKAACWQGSNTQFCFDDMILGKNMGQFSSQLERFDSALLGALLPESITPSGLIAGNINARWQHGQIQQLKGQLVSQQLNVSVDNSELSTQLPIEGFNIALDAADKSVRVLAELQSSVLGTLKTDLTVSNPSTERTLFGTLALTDFDLVQIKGFSRRIDTLAGKINGQVSLTGPLLTPSILGSLSIEQVAFKAPWSVVTIAQGQANLAFNKHQASFVGTLFDSQGGMLNGEGVLDWQTTPKFDLALSGERFRIAKGKNLWLQITPDIKMVLTEQVANLSGQLNIDEGKIKLKRLPEGAISASQDEVIVDKVIEPSQPLATAVAMDLAVSISDNVKIDSFGLTSKLGGSLLLKQQANSPLMANGEVVLSQGQYRAFGQDLQIDNGQLSFNGPLDQPFLNVTALRNPNVTEDGVVAGVKLTGIITAPELEVFSEPAMDQALALSYLLTGSSLENSNTSSDAILAQLLLTRGLAKGERRLNKFGEAIGIKDISLSSQGSGEQTKVAISGYLAPGIQVRYSIGIFDSMSEVAVRYQLLPRLYIEAVSGLNDSLDILYKFDWE